MIHVAQDRYVRHRHGRSIREIACENANWIHVASVADSREHGNEDSGYIKTRYFIVCRDDCKEEFAP
jgi:hypothetical protein